MMGLFIFFWVFTLLTSWIGSTTTIVNGEHNATAFKIKTLFFWVAVTASFFAGYYLTK
jgi:uncharacterized membrane protein